jgi:FAD synthase
MASLSRNPVIVQSAPLRIEGPVVKGFQRGRELGWPTANVDPKAWNNDLDLPEGVYFGWAAIASDHEVRKAVLSIGKNPTFGNKAVSLVILYHIERQLLMHLLTPGSVYMQ